MLYSLPVPLASISVQQHVPLAPYTTFGIGGPARFFCSITSEDQLLDAVRFARHQQLELFTLGGGSNLLVSDSGFNGLVLRIAIGSVETASLTPVASGSHIDFHVPAGMDWNEFVEHICQQGISGIECLAGIPGSVGGTPVQNVGAYGQEVAQTIHAVRALDLETLAFVTLPHADCGFSYRHSIFNSTHRNRYIVTQVTFRFNQNAAPHLAYADLIRHFATQIAAGHPPAPTDIYHAVREIRHSKGMLLVPGEQDCRSAGSFFKNPVVPASALDHIAAALSIDPAAIPHWPAGHESIKLPAAWLLEHAGFPKGFTLQPDSQAGISSRHTLALMNRGHATAADIVHLRDHILAAVQQRFGITLQQEPVQLGF